MTRIDALKAPCPYQIGKMCIADKCPKWRWERLCSDLFCEEKGGGSEVKNGIVVYNCHKCPGREGYCS